MKSVVLLTGSELRHNFLKLSLGQAFKGKLLRTYSESADNNIVSQVGKQDNNELRKIHLTLREQTEKDFFAQYCAETEDFSNSVFIKKGDINSDAIVEEIKNLNPDLIIAYGCSIVKPPLVRHFENRFINVHLGLSPYYRGSGTNYWPLVNNEPQFIGVTFMYIDSGIDTGKVFHQIRARIFEGDDVHKIGNRLIGDFAGLLPDIVLHFDDLADMPQIPIDSNPSKYYRNSDFSESSLEEMYANFRAGMIGRYLSEKEKTDANFPIIQNPALR